MNSDFYVLKYANEFYGTIGYGIEKGNVVFQKDLDKFFTFKTEDDVRDFVIKNRHMFDWLKDDFNKITICKITMEEEIIPFAINKDLGGCKQ